MTQGQPLPFYFTENCKRNNLEDKGGLKNLIDCSLDGAMNHCLCWGRDRFLENMHLIIDILPLLPHTLEETNSVDFSGTVSESTYSLID